MLASKTLFFLGETITSLDSCLEVPCGGTLAALEASALLCCFCNFLKYTLDSLGIADFDCEPVCRQAWLRAELLVTPWHRQDKLQGLLGFLEGRESFSMINLLEILQRRESNARNISEKRNNLDSYLTLHTCCSDRGGGDIAPTHFRDREFIP